MNMIATDIALEHIFEYYRDITRENVIKLLLRCKKMFDARVEVKKILTAVIKKDALYKWIKEELMPGNEQFSSEAYAQKIYDCNRLL